MQELSFPVTGMTCANCANTVTRTLKKTEGVSDASVNYASERASVTFDPAVVKAERLIERIRSESGAQIGGTLYSDALSKAGGPAPSYVQMMRTNLDALRQALSGAD